MRRGPFLDFNQVIVQDTCVIALIRHIIVKICVAAIINFSAELLADFYLLVHMKTRILQRELK